MTENPRQDNPAACVPTASVIVCTYNRSAYIIKCLAALWPQVVAEAAAAPKQQVMGDPAGMDVRAVPAAAPAV